MSRDMSGAGVKPEIGNSPGWDCSQHSRTPTQRYTVITGFIDPVSLDLVETNKKPHHRKPQTAFSASVVPKRSSVFRLPPACYCFIRCLLTPPASLRATLLIAPLPPVCNLCAGTAPSLALQLPAAESSLLACLAT